MIRPSLCRKSKTTNQQQDALVTVKVIMACIDCDIEPKCCGNFTRYGGCCNEPLPEYSCSGFCQLEPDIHDIPKEE